jgi:large subunit ribosomal protein L1
MGMAGKRLKAAREGVDREKLYPLPEAVKVIKSRAKAKFDETVEVAMNLGVDPKHADQMVRGVCALPNGSGRTLRVAVFARGPKSWARRTWSSRCRAEPSTSTAASPPPT